MVSNEANREEAKKSLELSKAALSRGDRVAALNLAMKSVRLYDSEESSEWLSGLRGQNSEDVIANFTPEQVEEVKEFLKVNKNDYYAVLGIKKTADADEVKRAYKKMALRFHPDKNQAPGADDAFKAVGTAFAALSDQEKRRRYDSMGVNAFSSHQNAFSSQGGFHQNDIPMEDILNMFFNVFADEGAMRFGGQQSMFFYQFPQFRQFPQPHRRRHFSHNTYDEDMERRRRERRELYDNSAVITRLLQMLPIFLMVLLSFLSNLLFPQPSE